MMWAKDVVGLKLLVVNLQEKLGMPLVNSCFMLPLGNLFND
jgi:hypothetical protein